MSLKRDKPSHEICFSVSIIVLKSGAPNDQLYLTAKSNVQNTINGFSSFYRFILQPNHLKQAGAGPNHWT